MVYEGRREGKEIREGVKDVMGVKMERKRLYCGRLGGKGMDERGRTCCIEQGES